MRVSYTAIGVVDNGIFPTKLTAGGVSYKSLVEDMARVTQDVRYFLEGVNSGNGWDHISTDKEPYTKDLIWPEIQWQITRTVKDK